MYMLRTEGDEHQHHDFGMMLSTDRRIIRNGAKASTPLRFIAAAYLRKKARTLATEDRAAGLPTLRFTKPMLRCNRARRQKAPQGAFTSWSLLKKELKLVCDAPQHRCRAQ